MSIKQQKESVIVNRFTLKISNINGRSAHKHPETFREAICPVLLIHLSSRRIEPHDVLDIGSPNPPSQEILGPAKDGMVLPKLDDAFCKIKHSFGVVVPVPIEPV